MNITEAWKIQLVDQLTDAQRTIVQATQKKQEILKLLEENHIDVHIEDELTTLTRWGVRAYQGSPVGAHDIPGQLDLVVAKRLSDIAELKDPSMLTMLNHKAALMADLKRLTEFKPSEKELERAKEWKERFLKDRERLE